MIIDGPELSIIIPVLNEAEQVQQCLWRLQPLRRTGVEIIVVDGGSDDDSYELAKPLADQVLQSEKGRARQMNTGAAASQGRVLLFLHVDTQLPDIAERMVYWSILDPMQLPHVWGRFDVSLSGSHFMFRIIEQMINLRSGLTGIATGDQGIFVMRHAFEKVGGYPDYPLMEDVAISKRLRKMSFPVCLKKKVITSSRRWEERGIFRTILLMWWIRWQYFLGATPQVLAKLAKAYEQSDS